MNWFGINQSAVLGIDISTAAIKLLELSRHGNNYSVESYAVVPLPQDAVIDKNITNFELVGQAIKIAVKQSGTRIKKACVAVSGASVMTKIINMPALLSELEIEEQINLEADQYIPYALEEVNLDFEIQGPTKNNSDMLDVLLVATRRENVEDRQAALQFAGLKTLIVDIEAYAMENAFNLIVDQLPPDIQDKTVAIIDIGAATTSINILNNRKSIYTREQTFGGKELTEEIQHRYNLSSEQAALAKQAGSLPPSYESEVLGPFKNALLQQISRAMQFFISSNVSQGVDAIVLAGGCASISDLDKVVENHLSIKTFIANPFADMTLSSRINQQALMKVAPSMMVACGLALRSFD